MNGRDLIKQIIDGDMLDAELIVPLDYDTDEIVKVHGLHPHQIIDDKVIIALFGGNRGTMKWRKGSGK